MEQVRVQELIDVINGDSKQKSKKAKDELVNLCKPIIDKISDLCHNYRHAISIPIRYQSESGSLTYYECNNDTIVFNYCDDREEEEYCDILINFKIDWFNEEYLSSFEREVIDAEIIQLNRMKEYHKAEINSIDLKLKSYEKGSLL